MAGKGVAGYGGGQWAQKGQQVQPAGWSQAGQQGWPAQAMAQARAAKGGLQSATPAAQVPVQAPALETYVVLTKGSDSDDVVIRTLTGEYQEKGSNHGRKVYQKTAGQVGMDFVEVFLYYWDSRDGPAFEGWWFGNKLGGTQVWSHCRDSSLTPPGAGWKIPWDGGIRPTFVVAPKADMERNEAESKAKDMAGDVQIAVTTSQAALEQARALAGDYTSAEALTGAEHGLAPQMPQLMSVQKKLTDVQRGAAGDTARLFAQLAMQLRTVQNSVNAELTKIRGSRTKAEKEAANAALDEKDMEQFQHIMPEALDKANAAEDMVEKAAITGEMIQAGGDDMDEVKRAVDETEQMAKHAQAAIGEARIFINAKLAVVRRFESERVKAQATEELGKLQTQLQSAQGKLNPLKQARTEFVQRAAAIKLVHDVLEKLSPAELDVDRAEEATAMLTGDNLTKEMMQQAEQAGAKAHEHITSAMKFVEAKKKLAQGLGLEELTKLEVRGRSAQERLTRLRTSHKEANERVASETLLREAASKLDLVLEAVAKASDAEGPFLMGVEELPLVDTLAAVKACEASVAAANTQVSVTRMYIATKLVEVKRFSSGPAAEAQEKLRECQKVLETHIARLTELKTATANRKGMSLMREAEAQVVSAEQLAQNVATAAEVFADDGKLMDLTTPQIREAAEATAKAERVANTALLEARKFITARQIDAKGRDASSQIGASLIKLQTRLSAANAEVAKNKKLSSSIEARLATKRVIEEARGKLKAAEEKVDKTADLASALNDLPPAALTAEPKPTKKVEMAAAEAQAALKTVARYLEVQTRSQGIAKDEMSKLQPQVSVAQEKLDAALATMRSQSERLLVDGILNESEQKVKDAEEAVKKAKSAEGPFLRSGELPVEEASSALKELEAAAQAAHTLVGSTKTFLAMKRLAAKRLAESCAKTTTDGLAALHARLDAASASLVAVRKGISDRKCATVKREAEAKVDAVREKVRMATEATKTFEVATEKEEPPEKMKVACEAAASANAEGQALIAETRTLLLTRQRDAKTSMADAKLLSELKELLDKLSPLQVELEKQKAKLKDQEHKFVAERLRKEIAEKIEELEGKLASVTKLSTPLLSEETDQFTASIFLTHVIETLRLHVKNTSSTPKALFDKIRGKGAKLSEAGFVQFVQDIPESKTSDEPQFTEEQLKSAFKGLGDDKDSFVETFRNRHFVVSVVTLTDAVSVKDSNTIRKLEVGELVEGIGEPVKDEGPGLMRLKVRADSDGKEGFVTMASQQGTSYLEPHSKYAAFAREVDTGLIEVSDLVVVASKWIEQKSEELKIVRTGPLTEIRTELMKARPKVNKVKFSLTDVRKKVSDGRRKIDQCMEAEKRRRQEAAEKKAADTMKQECTDAVTPIDEEVDKLLVPAKALVASKGADEENPLKALAKSEADLEAALATAVKATEKVKSSLDSIKTASPRGPFGEVRSALIKLKVKATNTEQKCKKQLTAIKQARVDIAAIAKQSVLAVLRTHVQQKGIQADALFTQLCKGAAQVSQKGLRAFVEAIPDLKVKASDLDLGLDCYEAGIGKLAFYGMMQDYYRVVKDIAITTTFEVKDSKTIRRLEVGELVEVLESGKEAIGLDRVRCRALVDQKEGWATVKGNQGTAFLEPTAKPYFACTEALSIGAAFESTGGEARKAQIGEVLEVLEGPRKEPPIEIKRIKGKAQKDGKFGFVTLHDAEGEHLELARFLVCRQSIAITTAFDISEGKALRKLDVGEALDMIEDPAEDSARSLTRCKARSQKDGKEGYVTMKGNQGTSYVEETTKHYRAKKSLPLEGRLQSGSNLYRMLEEGEGFEAQGAVQVESKPGLHRIKGRSLRDGSEGWFSLVKRSVQPWTPHYMCKQATALMEAPAAEEPKVVRQLVVGELLEALQCPELVKEEGTMMGVRLRAQSDGATGYANVKREGGAILLESVFVQE